MGRKYPPDFWATVRDMNWPASADSYRQVRADLLRTLSPAGITYLDRQFSAYRNKLDLRIREANLELNLSDDRYWDLLAHIVGLGKSTYDDVLAHPTKIRAHVSSAVESFAYLLPDEGDLQKIQPQTYLLWARRLRRTLLLRRRLHAVERGLNLLVPDLGTMRVTDIARAYHQIEELLAILVRGDAQGFLRNRKEYLHWITQAERAHKALEATLERSSLALRCGHGWPSLTSARNLLSDLEEYRPVFDSSKSAA